MHDDNLAPHLKNGIGHENLVIFAFFVIFLRKTEDFSLFF